MWQHNTTTVSQSSSNIQEVSNTWTIIPTIGMDCRKLYIRFSFFLVTDFVICIQSTHVINTVIMSNAASNITQIWSGVT